uniref:Transcription elongation factor n=1 Tax=Caenorhabditis japonica TaxID=281687 RepID=A0A8R1DX93_CAEJA
MSALEQAEDLCKQVDEICQNGMESPEQCIKLLDKLAKLPMTVDIIQSTSIGIKVNMMRKKVPDDAIAKRAKNIIKEWKNIVDGKSKPSRPDHDDAPPAKKQRKESVEEPVKSKPEPPQFKKPESSTNHRDSLVANFKSAAFPPKHLENDETRLKCAQLVLSALRTGNLPQGTLDPEELAVQIEEKLYSVHRDTNKNYSAAVRSRVFNLRDKKNPALRENVLTGVVRADKFATMTSEEMASPAIREMREQFTKEAIQEHQMSVQQGTPSDMFKCGKCGKKNCTYTQLQTRSSDEPMTTFVFCLECGNRWKFC